jgi:molecular chaperone DnaK
MQASSNIAQQAAAAQAGPGNDAGAGAGPQDAGAGSSKGKDDAVDAEFEEVKDKKKAS